MTILEARTYGKNLLINSPSPALDTDVFLQAILQKDQSFLLFHREEQLTEEQENTFNTYLNVRKTGMPVAYILGKKEFYGRNFIVTPDVLIPKPDTEILVEKSIEVLEKKLIANPNRILTICDMCTGSGCVGLSILAEIMDQHLVDFDYLPGLVMADISDKALAIARKNAEIISETTEDSWTFMSKIKFVRTNLFQNVTGTFDLVATNPPYIPAKEARDLLLDGRNEPILALDGDIDLFGNATGEDDGLGIMRNLVPQAVHHLSPKGVLIAESGEYNAEMTEYLFRQAGLSQTKIFKDLEGQLRDILGIKE